MCSWTLRFLVGCLPRPPAPQAKSCANRGSESSESGLSRGPAPSPRRGSKSRRCTRIARAVASHQAALTYTRRSRGASREDPRVWACARAKPRLHETSSINFVSSCSAGLRERRCRGPRARVRESIIAPAYVIYLIVLSRVTNLLCIYVFMPVRA